MTIASSASGLWRGLTSWATIFPAVASGACGLAIVASADAPVLARLLGAAVAGFGLFAAVVTRRRQASGPRVDSTIIEKVVLFAPVVEFDSGPMDEAPQEMVVERSEPPVAPIQDLQPAIWPVGSAIADEVDTSVTTVLGENQQLRDMAREMVTASDQAKEQFKVASSRSAEAESGMAELRAFNSELTESVQVIGAEVQRSIGIVEVTTSQAAAARACVETMATLSGAVSEVTQMIGDIARQSRMLAVNARIEAALAGDAGKGFVVVAREMGQLASQTADATEVIRQKTVQITSTVAETVESLEALVATIASVDTSSASIGRAIADQTGLAERVSSSLVDVHDAVAILSREIREAAQVAANGGMLAGLMVDATDSVDGLMVGLKGKLKGKGKLEDMGAGLGPTAADPELGAQELVLADGQELAA